MAFKNYLPDPAVFELIVGLAFIKAFIKVVSPLLIDENV
jgi:hypothetical protein